MVDSSICKQNVLLLLVGCQSPACGLTSATHEYLKPPCSQPQQFRRSLPYTFSLLLYLDSAAACTSFASQLRLALLDLCALSVYLNMLSSIIIFTTWHFLSSLHYCCCCCCFPFATCTLLRWLLFTLECIFRLCLHFTFMCEVQMQVLLLLFLVFVSLHKQSYRLRRWWLWLMTKPSLLDGHIHSHLYLLVIAL